MNMLGLDDFHFLRPLWLLALLVVPLLAWLRRRAQVSADPWRAVVDGPLLIAQSAGRTHPPRLPDALLFCGVVICVLALAGPAWRALPQPLLKLQAPLIVALDLSPSVRAADLKPDRLSRARLKLAELVRRRSDGQTALIAFSGEAFTVAPLTDDATTLDGLLVALDPSILPVPGQRPERAIRMAQRMLADSGARRGDLLLLTDHVGNAAIEAAREAAAAGLRVSALGLGTPEGAPVAVGGGGFMRDEAGNIRLPRLDEASLRALAAAGQGGYARFSADDADLRMLGFDAAPMAAEVPHSGAGSGSLANREMLRYQDEGPLLTLLLLPLAALAVRRGWLLAVPLLLMPLVQPVYAQSDSVTAEGRAGTVEGGASQAGAAGPGAVAQFWNDLWSRRDRQAWQALQEGSAGRAAHLAESHALRGSAAYRAGDMDTAQAEFAQGDDARNHYNRGNALAKLQRYEEALAAYDQALAREPAHADAKANRKAVEDWLQSQQQQQDGQRGDKGEREEDGENSQQGEQGEPDPEADPSEGTQNDSGQPRDNDQAQNESVPDSQSAQQNEEAGDEDGQEGMPGTADADDEAQQAFNEAMRQALEQAEDTAAPEANAEPLSADAMAEAEKRQALEQLMRRVPDDPGGLLRRKFLLEYQRRQREGDPP